MKHIGCFSGGKDSTALMLWMRENIGVPGVDWTPVFCDTKWEHPITYVYIEEINQSVLNSSLVTVQSEKYPGGMVQLCTDRKGIPSVKRRFCTGELKVEPLHRYYESLDDEVMSYQGIRADESASRASMREEEWLDDAGGYWIRRPILRWSAVQCFAMMAKHNVKPNPLYLMGSTRVGCWPCIMTGLVELKRLLHSTPEIRQRLIDLEKVVNDANPVTSERKWPSTFFKAGTIPARFCSISGDTDRCNCCNHDLHPGEVCGWPYEKGETECGCQKSTPRRAYVPTAEDVFRYIESVDEDQLPMFPARSCMSVYNLCE